ncbi:MAG: PAS domain S-box protein [Deltaproteobacteria bacterium]|nr:PAS domain S-box protein [Deltaproteobacteria bacterium]
MTEGNVTTQLIEAALERAPLGICLFDPRGAFLHANAAATRILGMSIEELRSGKPRADWKLTHYSGQAIRVTSLPHHKALATGEPQCAELRLGTNGQERIILVSAFPLRGPDGSTLGVASYFTEVTEEERSKEAAARANASFKQFVERSPDAIVLHRNGKVLFANEATLRGLGFEKQDEIVGRSTAELTHPDDRAAVTARIRDMMEKGHPAPLREERFLGRDGRVFAADTFAMPVVYDGQLAIMAIGHDASERKQLLEDQRLLRAAAQHHAAELQAILDNVTSGVIVFDLTGRITLANRATESVLGIELPQLEDERVGTILERIKMRDLEGNPVSFAQSPLRAALQGQVLENVVILAQNPRSGRDVWLSFSAAPIRDGPGSVVAAVAIIRDVTQLVHLDRLKDQFIRIVAHELRTPVAVMKVSAEMVGRVRTPEARQRGMEGINRGVERIERVVDEMIDAQQLIMGRMELHPEPIELRELLQSRVAKLALSHPRHPLHVVGPPLRVQGDPERIRQVVDRLLDNAVRYSPEGGPVDVSLERAGASAVVSVEDHGVGIPKERQDRIFRRFFRAHAGTREDYGGLGLGLSICSEIVERHGGRMWFESEEGVGSSFHFSLPMEHEGEAAGHRA